jgi:hypothetical protein
MMRIFSSRTETSLSSFPFSTNPREVMSVFTFALAQPARTLAAPAVKLIIAGTRPAAIRAKMATPAPLALGTISPTASPASDNGCNLRPTTWAPISNLR